MLAKCQRASRSLSLASEGRLTVRGEDVLIRSGLQQAQVGGARHCGLQSWPFRREGLQRYEGMFYPDVCWPGAVWRSPIALPATPDFEVGMNQVERLQHIQSLCISARRLASSQREPMVASFLDMLLLELGDQIARIPGSRVPASPRRPAAPPDYRAGVEDPAPGGLSP
ncbi:hypothetical protein ABEG18_23765 [Alsobacter sp. KACC 23698]|uniref:Uncharacterized protein n=1 Tax=Alsobacter sp. KACC 23698 TaxID=3149229 RepID=A0AAU7JEP5_9HYPH